MAAAEEVVAAEMATAAARQAAAAMALGGLGPDQVGVAELRAAAAAAQKVEARAARTKPPQQSCRPR